MGWACGRWAGWGWGGWGGVGGRGGRGGWSRGGRGWGGWWGGPELQKGDKQLASLNSTPPRSAPARSPLHAILFRSLHFFSSLSLSISLSLSFPCCLSSPFSKSTLAERRVETCPFLCIKATQPKAGNITDRQVTNQTTNQPAKQPTKRPINQVLSQQKTTNQPAAKQPAKRPTNQVLSQQKTTNQPAAKQPAKRPTNQLLGSQPNDQPTSSAPTPSKGRDGRAGELEREGASNAHDSQDSEAGPSEAKQHEIDQGRQVAESQFLQTLGKQM